MRAYDIIEKKRQNLSLTKEEIDFFIDGYTNEAIPDYQMSALLMAICFNGMTDDETYNLTIAMLNSGSTIELSSVKGIIVDKHSTGGVGDSTTMALAPILASLGLKVAKMSGRGLGFTGGTLDKLESIPNFDINLDTQKFIDIVNNVGCAVIGQTSNLVPADKKMYALRDVTATVDCLPLIASSIMSKKLASGASIILLDVKYGNGAFMKTNEDAVVLAKKMVDIGTRAGKIMGAIITDMSQPLSNKVGNAIEVLGVLEVLDGKKSRLYYETVEVAKQLLILSELYNKNNAKDAIDKVISSGDAKAKFIEMVKMQSGDINYIINPEKFKLGTKHIILAKQTGYINEIITSDIGKAALVLGGGRVKKTDTIDYSVGLEMKVNLGDFVYKGDAIIELYHNEKNLSESIELCQNAVIINDEKPTPHKIAYAYVDKNTTTYY